MLANFQTFNILKFMCALQAWKFKSQDWETKGNNTENSIGNIVMEQKLEIRNFQTFHLEKKKRMDSAEDIDWGKHCLMVHSHSMLSRC